MRGPVLRDLLVFPTVARDRPSPYDKGEGYRSAGACPARFFCCLNQDFQDEQDVQDGAAQERKETTVCAAVKQRGGQAPALRFAARPFLHRRARACPSRVFVV